MSRDLDIKSRIQGIVFDKLSAGFDDIAHEDREHAVCLDGVVFVEIHLEHLALFRVHGGFEELLGVHFPEAFEPLDREAAFADFEDLREDFRDREKRVGDRLVAIALDEFENWMVAIRVVLDFQALAGEFVDEFLGGDRLMEFDELGAAAAGGIWFVFLQFGGWVR